MNAEMTDRTKIIFDLERGETPYETERVWAERISDNRFRILNSPFFVFGISFEDEVEGEPYGNMFKFVRVVQRSGRSTYRIILQNETQLREPNSSNGGSRFARPDVRLNPPTHAI